MRGAEAKFQTKFTRWLRNFGWTGAYELKVAIGENAMPFVALADHQRAAL